MLVSIVVKPQWPNAPIGNLRVQAEDASKQDHQGNDHPGCDSGGPGEYRGGLGVQTEVEGLKREVEQLREQEASQTQPAVQVRPSEKENAATTILVFRDGHRSELHNYAIVGHTLWVLTEERARKIPIADLDLDATKKVNADHGVDFQLP